MSTLRGDTYLNIEDAHLKVTGNVHANAFKLGLVEVVPGYSLASATNVGNTTSQTVQFTNTDTSFVASSNVEIGKTLKITNNTDAANIYVDVSTSGEIVSNVWSLPSKIYPNDPELTSEFGSGCAISDDGNYMVIADHTKNETVYNQGAAYVYKWNGTAWTQQTKLLPDAESDQEFGFSINFGFTENTTSTIAITSDGSKIVVGAHEKDETTTRQGVVYVYTRTNETWSAATKITGENEASSFFGVSVDISADGNYIIAGAPGKNQASDDEGAAYIYRWTGSSWSQYTKIVGQDEDNAYFGSSVAINSDGTRVVVGALAKNEATVASGDDQGAVYIFDRTGTNTWGTYTNKITTGEDGGVNDFFGSCVDISADGRYIIVGSPNDTINGTAVIDHQGSAFIFKKVGGSLWEQQAKLVGKPEQNAHFGCSVKLSSDGTKALIGSRSEDVNENDQGAAYLYTRTGETWGEKTRFVGDSKYNGQFGTSCGITSNGSTLLIGARYEGVAYVFTRGDRNDSTLNVSKSVHVTENVTLGKTLKITNEYDSSNLVVDMTTNKDLSNDVWSPGTELHERGLLPVNNAQYGRAVYMSRDGNYLAVGAYLSDEAGADQGCVFVYVWDGGQWVKQAKFVASVPEDSARYGEALALTSDGSKLAVSAPNEDISSADNKGAVYIYKRVDTFWSLEEKIQRSSLSTSPYFGSDVSFSGDGTYLVIGARQQDTNNQDLSGAAYVYKWNGTAWDTGAAELISTDPDPGDYFGNALMISEDGNYITVGAPREAQPSNREGAAYVYRRTGDNTWSSGTRIVPSTTINTEARFGRSTILNADGSILTVSAYRADETDGTPTDAGKIYMFERSGNNDWTQIQMIENTLGHAGEVNSRLGTAIALSNDSKYLFAGFEQESENNKNKIWIYERSGPVWTFKQELHGTDDGQSVKILAINRDGSKLATGCWLDDVSQTNEGSVTYFTKTNHPILNVNGGIEVQGPFQGNSPLKFFVLNGLHYNDTTDDTIIYADHLKDFNYKNIVSITGTTENRTNGDWAPNRGYSSGWEFNVFYDRSLGGKNGAFKITDRGADCLNNRFRLFVVTA